MPTITEQLTQLVSDKNDLINNLETKGITGLTGDETFTELIPEVLNIPSGEDLSEYFTGTIEKGKYSGAEYIAGIQHAIKKIPKNSIANGTDISYAFAKCENLTTCPEIITTGVTNTEFMFYYCSNLTTVSLFDTSNVIHMNSMFYNCSNLTTVPNFNTSNVTITEYMFHGCSNLTTVPNFDTSNVTDMHGMFSNCFNLTTVPNFNTSNVTNMYEMFRECSNLTTVPNFNTSNVTSMSGMFRGCNKLTTIPNFDTSNVTSMEYMLSSSSLSGAYWEILPLLKCDSVINVNKIFNTNPKYYPYLITLGGFKNLGKAYLTTQSSNYGNYKLDLHALTNLTHDSLMNVINNLYDIATAGVAQQSLVLGSTNLEKLTIEEIAIATNKGWAVS